jgi:hypothetical protein
MDVQFRKRTRVTPQTNWLQPKLVKWGFLVIPEEALHHLPLFADSLQIPLDTALKQALYV